MQRRRNEHRHLQKC